jgi:hypothetical protein
VNKLNKFINENDDGYTIETSRMCNGDVCVCPDRDIEFVKQSDYSMKVVGLKKGIKFKASLL